MSTDINVCLTIEKIETPTTCEKMLLSSEKYQNTLCILILKDIFGVADFYCRPIKLLFTCLDEYPLLCARENQREMLPKKQTQNYTVVELTDTQAKRCHVDLEFDGSLAWLLQCCRFTYKLWHCRAWTFNLRVFIIGVKTKIN